MHFLKMAALGIIGVIASTGITVAQTYTMKFTTPTLGDINVEWLKLFKDGVEARTKGSLKVELYPGSQLGSISQTIDGVLLGTIEAAFAPTGFLVGIEPRYQVFDAVGIFDDLAHGQRIFRDPAIHARLATLGAGKGVELLTILVHSPINVVSKRTIRTLADLKGMKIRTYATPMQMAPLTKLGASPIPMTLGDTLPALQNGTIDAAVASMPVITTYKYYDTAKYVTELPAWQTVVTATVNKAWLAGLPAEFRTIIAEEARKADAAATAWGTDDLGKAAKSWTDNGATVLTLSAEDKRRFTEEFTAATVPLLSANAKVKEDYEAFVATSAKYRR